MSYTKPKMLDRSGIYILDDGEVHRKHRYDIVTESGDIVLSILSSFTNLDFDAYAAKFVVPMLASLSEVEGERVFYTEA